MTASEPAGKREEVVEFVRVGDAQLWTATSGSGPPLALCHGGPGCWDDLGALAAMIDDRVTVHRFDQRACGRSTGSLPLSVEQAVADLDALREHWGYERWTVGGHSWGAALALAYAVAHPDRVEAVVYLCGTGLDWPAWREQYQAEVDARLSAAQRTERDALRDALDAARGTPAFDDAARAFCRIQWSTDFVDRGRALALAEQLLRLGLLPNFEANRVLNEDWLRLCREERFRRAASSITCPLLIVQAQGDPRAAASLAALTELPGARFDRVRGGHYPWIESPEQMRAALRGFVEDASANRARG